jgi:hypothetical protein
MCTKVQNSVVCVVYRIHVVFRTSVITRGVNDMTTICLSYLLHCYQAVEAAHARETAAMEDRLHSLDDALTAGT